MRNKRVEHIEEEERLETTIGEGDIRYPLRPAPAHLSDGATYWLLAGAGGAIAAMALCIAHLIYE